MKHNIDEIIKQHRELAVKAGIDIVSHEFGMGNDFSLDLEYLRCVEEIYAELRPYSEQQLRNIGIEVLAAEGHLPRARIYTYG